MKKTNRQERQKLAQSTLTILETKQLGDENIQELIDASVQGTRSYSPKDALPPALAITVDNDNTKSKRPAISVINTTTLRAARDLVQDDANDASVAVLNFASARNPGGGFLNGSLAQEESLAMHSGLYACLRHDRMYHEHNKLKSGGIYTDWCIFSPQVPAFRTEDNPWQTSAIWNMNVLTCPCINQGRAMLEDEALEEALEQRMHRMMSVLAAHHVGSLVLGAWGCGVFQNDPHTIARLFRKVLDDPKYQAWVRWPTIVFAVLDSSRNKETFNAFHDVFVGSHVLKDENDIQNP